MRELTHFLGSYIRLSPPVPVTPLLGAFLVSPEAPPGGWSHPHASPDDLEPPEGELPLTFWACGRAVASRWYRAEAWKAIREIPLFAYPVRLAFHATFPGDAPGWMRVDVGAIGERENQLWRLLERFRRLPDGLPLLHGGEGRVGRYHYRLVDEYGSRYQLCRKTSRRTLTLRQLIEVLETADSPDLTLEGLGIVVPWWNQMADSNYGPAECIAFATVESEQYPDLIAWYEERAATWREERFPDDPADSWDPEDDDEEEEGEEPVRREALSGEDDTEAQLVVTLERPDGWRWMGEEEWRSEISDLAHFEERAGICVDEMLPPQLFLVNTPPGYEAESASVVVQVTGVDEEWGEHEAGTVDTEATLLYALRFMASVYDDFEVPIAPAPFEHRGLSGHRAGIRLAAVRRDKPTLHFTLSLNHLEAEGKLIEALLSAPTFDAPEGLWDELAAIYDSLRVRWSHLPSEEAA